MLTFASHLTIAETFYILCISEEKKSPSPSMTVLENTGYLKTQESSRLDYTAARYKCVRKSPLADCCVLALSKNIQGAAPFARKEMDIAKESQRSILDLPLPFFRRSSLSMPGML